MVNRSILSKYLETDLSIIIKGNNQNFHLIIILFSLFGKLEKLWIRHNSKISVF
jgi:hypothetical protein